MSFSINRATILGNISQEPQLRYTQGGIAVCNLSVATNHSVKQGEKWEEIPTFHNVIIWRGKAEFIAKECRKGDKVYIEGRLQTSSWEDENKIKKYKTEIVADEVIPMNKRGDNKPVATEEPKAEKEAEVEFDVSTFEEPVIETQEDFNKSMEAKPEEEVESDVAF